MVNWQQGMKGGVGGGLAGGSMGGPWGAGIGAGLGFAGGLFGGDGGPSDEEKQQMRMMQNYWGELQNRQAPQMGPAAQAGYSGFRQNQSDLISRLEAMSQGKGPSLAMEQMKAGMDRSQSAQASMANSGRGGPMMAMQAANNMGRLQAQGTQDAGAARIAEQQMALGQLGMTLHSARGSDEMQNRFDAGARNENGMANLDARLRSMGMNDQARLGVLGAMGNWNGNQTAKSGQPGMGDQLMAGGAGMFAAGLGRSAGPAGAKAPGAGSTMNPYGGGWTGGNWMNRGMGGMGGFGGGQF